MDRRLINLIAVIAPFAAAGVLVAGRGSLDNTNLALLLVVVVVAIAATGRRVAGAVAAVSASVGFDFFLTRPYYSLSIATRDDFETAVILLIVGVGVAEIAAGAARARRRADRRTVDVDRLRRMIHASAAGHHPAAVGDALAIELRTLLPVVSCRYETARSGRALPRLDHDGTVTMGDRTWRVASDGFPSDTIEMDAGHGARFVMLPFVGVVAGEHELRLATSLVEQFSQMTRDAALRA